MRRPPPPAGLVVGGLKGAPPIEARPFRGLLSDALGGVALGRTILVAGKKGTGKSTLCAELAAAMAAELGGALYWLDREMDIPLVHALFVRTSSPVERVRYIGRDRNASAGQGTWREAFEVVGDDAAVVVVDSIQRWTRGVVSEQTALIEGAKGLRPTVLLISHANKRGEAFGPSGNEHDCDASVLVRQRVIEVDKCRWTPTPRLVERPKVPIQATSESKKSATSSKAS